MLYAHTPEPGPEQTHAMERLQIRLHQVSQLRILTERQQVDSRQHSYTEVGYTLRGVLGVAHGDCEFTLHPNELMIIPANISAQIWNTSGYGESAYLSIGFEALLDGVDLFAGHELVVKQESLPPPVTNLWIEMAEHNEKLLERMDPLDRLVMAGKVRLWLAEFCRITGIDLESGFTKSHSRLQQALQYMRLHFNQSITLCEVAQHVHLSQGHLRTIFTSESGASFRTTLHNIRMSHAKMLLSSTDLTIGEIADRTGYNDVHHFSRSFTKSEGTPPSIYRAFTVGPAKVLFEDDFSDIAHTAQSWSARQGASFTTYGKPEFLGEFAKLKESRLIITAPGDYEWSSLILNPEVLPREPIRNYVIETKLALQRVRDPVRDKIGVVLRTGFHERILFMYRLHGFDSFSRAEPDLQVSLARPSEFKYLEGELISIRIEVRREHIGSHVSFFINEEFVGARRFALLQGAQQIGIYVHFAEGVFERFCVTHLQ